MYLLFTREDFPRLLRLRRSDLRKKAYQNPFALLGPFASSYKLNEVLKLVRPIFPWCNKSPKKDKKPCFYYHLDLCPGACCEQISALAYQNNLRQLVAFLQGKKKSVQQALEKQMKSLAAAEKFEEAAKIRNKLAMIQEITSQHYHLQPDLILPSFQVDAAQNGIAALRRILSEEGVASSDNPLHRIECYDVSNTQGKNATVSMVTFLDGQADHSEYKYFKIRSLDTPNDYFMLQEAIERRQKHPEWGRADLMVIDGGRGQLRAVKRISQLTCPIISIVKNPDRLVLAIPKEEESGFETKILRLSQDHPALRLVQQLRDEAHRFAKKQHSRLRDRFLL